MSTLSPAAVAGSMLSPDDAEERWLSVCDWLVTLSHDELDTILRITCGAASAPRIPPPEIWSPEIARADPVRAAAIAQLYSALQNCW